jgi:hypothetical protein
MDKSLVALASNVGIANSVAALKRPILRPEFSICSDLVAGLSGSTMNRLIIWNKYRPIIICNCDNVHDVRVYLHRK